MIADGMGGYDDGEKASQTVVAELSNWWNSFHQFYLGMNFRE